MRTLTALVLAGLVLIAGVVGLAGATGIDGTARADGVNRPVLQVGNAQALAAGASATRVATEAGAAEPVTAESVTAESVTAESGVESAATAAQAPTTRPAALAKKGRTGGEAAVIRIDTDIDRFLFRIIKSRFDDARAAGAEVVILHLTSPGGEVFACMEIARFLREQNDLHTITLVDEYAYSGGIWLGISTDELVMLPGSVIGDAAPVSMGMGEMGATERAKIESPVLADFRMSAIRNGYDPLLVAAMVSMPRVVHYVESPQGERRFVEPAEYQTLTGQGWKPVEGVPDPVDRADTLLTVDDELAAKLGLSGGTYPSLDAFISSRGFEVVATYVPTAEETFMKYLVSPATVGLAMTVFMLSLYIALYTPGTGAAEVVCAVSLGVVIVLQTMSDTASWWEIVMVILGIALLAVEVFILPGFGIAGISGALLVLGGLVLTFVPTGAPVVPDLPGQPALPWWPVVRDGLQTGFLTVVCAVAASMGLMVWLVRYLPKIPIANRLVLQTVAGGTVATTPEGYIATWPAVGATAVAVTDLRPSGSIELPDPDTAATRVVSAVSDTGFVRRGTLVKVISVEGSHIVVRAVT